MKLSNFLTSTVNTLELFAVSTVRTMWLLWASAFGILWFILVSAFEELESLSASSFEALWLISDSTFEGMWLPWASAFEDLWLFWAAIFEDLESLSVSVAETLVMVSTMLVVIASAAYVASRLQKRTLRERAESFGQFVNRLKTLTESAQAIEEIEAEIRERQATVEKLRRDIDTYEHLKTVNRDELEAVTRVLEGELRRASRHNFWVNFLTNLKFFLLGVAASIVVTLLLG